MIYSHFFIVYLYPKYINMSMTWEGGSPTMNNQKFQESCDHCGREFELLDEYFENDGVKSCPICFTEAEIVRKRNEAIDSIINKEWWQFWK